MKNRFSIGEMAKLHNTPIKTLRYYGEIGLFEPIEVDKSNGYRYYSTEQFEQLHTINYLKALGLSLKEIKSQLETRNFDDFLHLLQRQKESTESKIKELERNVQRFENRMKELRLARNIRELEVVRFREIEERKIVRLHETIRSEPELELSLRKLEQQSNLFASIFIGGVGLTVAKENLALHKFDEYNSIFILLEESNQFVNRLPQGMYASIYYRGNHQDSPPHYRMLLDEIYKNGFTIAGDSIERTIVDHYISHKKEDYLTEIQIPVFC
ncbi:MerR family transcriptional regulator [Brevibacillus sp. SYSU BS000544]|uniref:MerR family transcriptional regulator n=1 Tax=Brevibacillus sp. SYSU BS000544 TaxID=3416443 RepID=UPI003CE4C4DB